MECKFDLSPDQILDTSPPCNLWVFPFMRGCAPRKGTGPAGVLYHYPRQWVRQF